MVTLGDLMRSWKRFDDQQKALGTGAVALHLGKSRRSGSSLLPVPSPYEPAGHLGTGRGWGFSQGVGVNPEQPQKS